MARQAEAERERRAKVITAEGEVQAASKLAQAAQMIAEHPGALQLRLYQTLVEVSGEASSTIIFPVPIDMSGGMRSPAHAGPDSVDGLDGAGAGDPAAGQKQLEAGTRGGADPDSSDAREPLGARRRT